MLYDPDIILLSQYCVSMAVGYLFFQSWVIGLGMLEYVQWYSLTAVYAW